MKKIIALILLVLVTTVAASATALLGRGSVPLIYMAEEYPPWNFSKNGRVTGLSPELLRLMWKKMGCAEQPIEILPWARGYKYVQENKNHVLMTMVRTEQREQQFKWVGPISTTVFFLIGLAESDIELTSIEDAKRYRIGTIREDAAEQILKSMGLGKKSITSLTRIEQALKMLRAKRIDLLAYDRRSFVNLIRKEGLQESQFEYALRLKEERDYYAFHKATPDVVIKEFQRALDGLKAEHVALLERYFNPAASSE